MTHSWEIKEANKVLCAILSVEQVTMHWAQGFRKLIIPGPDPITISGLPFDHARNVACQEALNRGCEFLYFLDSDVIPPLMPSCVFSGTTSRLFRGCTVGVARRTPCP